MEIKYDNTITNDWSPFTNKSGALAIGLNNITGWIFTTPSITTETEDKE